VLTGAAVCLVAVTGALAGAAASAGGDRVVLGSEEFAPNGKGFGKPKPRTIFNGGVPSGLVEKIRWKQWGNATARGRGLGNQYKPGGGYYRKPVKVRLRATRIGTCPGSDRRAYTKLRARFQKRPGGRFGKWFSWSGADTICSFN
jgi:hypothetical protein